MTRAALINEILDLPPEDRLHLVEEIWDSLAVSPANIPIPDWHLVELDNRLADPDERASASWEEVQGRLQQPENEGRTPPRQPKR